MSQWPRGSPPVEPAEWYCIIRGRQLGPMARSDLQVKLLDTGDPGAVVWRPGMAMWLPVESAPELLIAPNLLMPLRRRVRALSNARTNCIGVFIASVVGVIVVVASLATGWFDGTEKASLEEVLMASCIFYLASPVILYATIYLPFRWRVIRQVPRAHRWLGLIGLVGIVTQATLWLGFVLVQYLRR